MNQRHWGLRVPNNNAYGYGRGLPPNPAAPHVYLPPPHQRHPYAQFFAHQNAGSDAETNVGFPRNPPRNQHENNRNQQAAEARQPRLTDTELCQRDFAHQRFTSELAHARANRRKFDDFMQILWSQTYGIGEYTNRLASDIRMQLHDAVRRAHDNLEGQAREVAKNRKD